MKSIFWKILLWFFVSVAVCVIGSEVSGRIKHFSPGSTDYLSRNIDLETDTAISAYERGGKAELQQYMDRLQHYFPGHYALLTRQGMDVLTGNDRTASLQHLSKPRPWKSREDRVVLAWPSHDGKYLLFMDTVLPPGPPSMIPFYLWGIAAALAFAYALAIHLGTPLRTLEQTVERFGRGDFGVRASTRRKDEFGNLQEAFNRMADRIQTLLTAERRLLQDVSHELRSPLARLEFAVALARNSPDNPKAFDRITKETGHLAKLVSELLQVTRAENDPSSRIMDEFSLASVLRSVLDDNAVEEQAHNCRLNLQVRDPIIMRGDRDLLRRAFENVLRNAIRYAPPATPVEVLLERENDAAIVRIRDFGPGVSEESLPYLFRPFFRAEVDRNRNNGGGVGLGLSIAMRAIRLHEGRIRARNANPGLIIEIELPLPVQSEQPSLVQ